MMTGRSTKVLSAVAVVFAVFVTNSVNAQQRSQPIKAVQIIGLADVKDNAKGVLSVENGQLQFVHSKSHSEVAAISVQDVATGADSQRAVGKTIGMLSMAAPYGGGRFLSLFRKKIDTLTIQYRDADGGLHGTIFSMPVGTAEVIKKDLVAQGAHTSTPAEQNAEVPPSTNSLHKKEKQ
jgi:hypothetical protein